MHISSKQNQCFHESCSIHLYLTFNPMRHEICASSDTITLKVDSYGQEKLSWQENILQRYWIWHIFKSASNQQCGILLMFLKFYLDVYWNIKIYYSLPSKCFQHIRKQFRNLVKEQGKTICNCFLSTNSILKLVKSKLASKMLWCFSSSRFNPSTILLPNYHFCKSIQNKANV